MPTSLRIVMADEDAADRSRLGFWLRELGHNVTAFADGPSLIDRCRRGCPDLVISDMHMPSLDGLRVATQLRQDCNVPIILMSGSWTADLADRASGVGAHILLKPVLPLNLVAAISAVLARPSNKPSRDAMTAIDSPCALAGATDHAIFTLDADSQVNSWNRGAERLFGTAKVAAIGKAWLDVCPDGAELLAGVPRNFDGWLTRADGTQVWASGSAFRLDNGMGTGIILRDRTIQKVRESATVARLAELERADANCNAFLGTLTHELRNQIAPVVTNSHLVHLRAQDPEMRAMAERLERQVHQLSRGIEDLMDMARVRQGKVRLDRQAVNLCEVVRRAVDAVGAQLDAAGHELTVQLPEPPPFIIGDLNRLVQVVVNLLSNAIKYTPAQGKIALSVTIDGHFVDLCVADRGIGLSPEHLDTIFDLFQVNEDSPHSQRGLGVGLAIVKDLVQLHGGTIAASSAGIGQGTEFIVRLPCA